MLDASAFVPTNPLNLTEYPASFVSLSFYKMFGFPTGLGCLLVRNDIAGMLHKTYFSGGSVVLSSSDERVLLSMAITSLQCGLSIDASLREAVVSFGNIFIPP